MDGPSAVGSRVGPLFRMHDQPPAAKVVQTLTESLCDARHLTLRGACATCGNPLSLHGQGPHGPVRTGPRGPCRSAAEVRAAPVPRGGAGGSAAGRRCVGSAPPAHRGRVRGVGPRRRWCDRGTCSLRRAGRAASDATVSTGYGRLRASPEPTALGVTGLLSPADRSRTLGRGPTAYLQYATRSSGATRGFLLSRPWLARTPGPTKPPSSRSRAVRVRVGPNSDTPPGPRRPCLPRCPAAGAHPHAAGLREVTRGRGTAPAASSRARCRACRVRSGTG